MITNYIRDIEIKHNITVLYITKYGSKLYGTDDENSDTDYKGIFIPNKLDVLVKKDIDHINFNSSLPSFKNSSDDIDIELVSIFKFFNLLKKGETGTIDLLFSMFSNNIIYEDFYFTSIIKDNYKSFINKNIKAFLGYSVSMAKKYNIRGERYSELVDFGLKFNNFSINSNFQTLRDGWEELKSIVNDSNYKYIKFVFKDGPRGSKIDQWEYIEVLGKYFTQTVTLPYFMNHLINSKEKYGNRVKSNNENIDWKGLSHSMRVLLECQELLKDNFISFPLTDKKFIKDIKTGKLDIEYVMNKLESNFNKADSLYNTSNMPLTSDDKLIDSIIISLLDKY
jgi:hypothetical protein